MDARYCQTAQLSNGTTGDVAAQTVSCHNREVSTLAERIVIARKRKGWSQNRLNTEAGLSQGIVNRYESGERGKEGGSGDTLGKLAKALGVRVNWLMTGEDPMEDGPTGPVDPFSRRTDGARLAREAGVDERAVQSVLDDPPPSGSEAWPTLKWANMMQLRHAELVHRFDDGARATHIPPPPPSHPPVSTSRLTPTPAEEPAKPKRRTGKA
jgi:transcriptional regulator with XRE-family HTH domain